MRVPSVLCWLRTVWYRVRYVRPISGHSYAEIETHEDCRVSVLECEECGHVSISWEPQIWRRG